MKKVFLLVVSGILFGCNSLQSTGAVIDDIVFEYFGKTVFADATEVSLKEILLDTGSLKGKQVIVEGKVVHVGSMSTFIVLSDQGARMLVNMTGIADLSELESREEGGGPIAVLGTISSGQMGLPAIEARAVAFGKREGGKEAS
jgi:hypothetical protein